MKAGEVPLEVSSHPVGLVYAVAVEHLITRTPPRSKPSPAALAGLGRIDLEPDAVRGAWRDAPGTRERVDYVEAPAARTLAVRQRRLGRTRAEGRTGRRQLDADGPGRQRHGDIDAAIGIGVRVLDAVRRDLADEQPQRLQPGVVHFGGEAVDDALARFGG